jgi:hypothetical protein
MRELAAPCLLATAACKEAAERAGMAAPFAAVHAQEGPALINHNTHRISRKWRPLRSSSRSMPMRCLAMCLR